MSINISAYVVDVKELIRLIGSCDNNFLVSLKFDISGEIAVFRKEYPRLNQVTDIADVLGYIIFGDFRPSRVNNSDYGFALEMICKGLGKTMHSKLLSDITASRFSNLHELNSLGQDPGPLKNVIPWPQSKPRIGCITRQNMREKYDIATQLFTVQDDFTLKSYYHEYIGWLIEANKSKGDLVFFIS